MRCDPSREGVGVMIGEVAEAGEVTERRMKWCNLRVLSPNYHFTASWVSLNRAAWQEEAGIKDSPSENAIHGAKRNCGCMTGHGSTLKIPFA